MTMETTYPVSYELREAIILMDDCTCFLILQFVTLENNQELIYDFANKISGEATTIFV